MDVMVCIWSASNISGPLKFCRKLTENITGCISVDFSIVNYVWSCFINFFFEVLRDKYMWVVMGGHVAVCIAHQQLTTTCVTELAG
jgi:hypothetical protein